MFLSVPFVVASLSMMSSACQAYTDLVRVAEVAADSVDWAADLDSVADQEEGHVVAEGERYEVVVAAVSMSRHLALHRSYCFHCS